MELRTKIGTGLLIGIVALLGTAHAAAAAPVGETRYACDDGQRLIVRQFGETASVQFIDRTYQLNRKRSSIGQKYISPTAALIIDGPAAVFVADDRLQLGQCFEANRMASK